MKVGSGRDDGVWTSPGDLGTGWGHPGVEGRKTPRHHVAPSASQFDWFSPGPRKDTAHQGPDYKRSTYGPESPD